MNPRLSTLLKATDPASDDRSDGVATTPSGGKSSPLDWRARTADLIPWAILLGFVALLIALFGNRFVPARPLEIASVVIMRQAATGPEPTLAPAEVANASGGSAQLKNSSASSYDSPMLFQASGWVEPDPYPVMATALIDGVIDQVFVLEGEKVQRGQLLATLIDDDAKLDLQTAQNVLASLKAETASHIQEIAIAEAQLTSLTKQVAAAEARREEAADVARRREKIASDAIAEREVAEARLKLATRKAEVEALAITEAELRAKLNQLEEYRDYYEARTAEAETEVARKQLALERTQIKAPIDGRILRLRAMPGQKKLLRMDHHESATIAILYDPHHLQVRIDVPLAEAAQLSEGQLVRVRSELLPDRVFHGRVTRIVGEADLQRNTLQAKVAIENPDDRLRPDMLCRAEFLDAMQADDAEPSALPPAVDSSTIPQGESRIRIFVPESALVNAESGETKGRRVWKVDSSGNHIAPQQVTLGRETRDDHRLVLSGLRPGDRVVLNPPPDLKPGQRFRPLSTGTGDQP